MNNNRKYWHPPCNKSKIGSPSDNEKNEISDFFQPIIEKFRIQSIKKNPNKKFNYLIDIYTKWNKNYFYICEKYKSEMENRIQDEFEVKIARLKFIEKNNFELSYLLHNDQWQKIFPVPLSLKDCAEMINSNPIFQPIG